ncbi:651_t:CDS:2 [Funneliformis caledonium]|uniref:651_t:CDS:1 n=1 Tax=Funneliformis caledonium TaxID=1117310 RepID=A0A9N9AP11_9GLOM|nr:651_t:CDS:2 [Funneliformis caledonium]
MDKSGFSGRRYPSTGSKPSPNTKCQKCLETGHWTYECKNKRAYSARPTRTQQLTKPLKPISIELPDDFKTKSSSSSEDSGSSSSDSLSDSDSDTSASSSSFSSDSGSGSSSSSVSSRSRRSSSSSSSSELRGRKRKRAR